MSPGGLGAEAAKALSIDQPALLILAGRNMAKPKNTEKQINKASLDVPIRLLRLDLRSHQQTCNAAEESIHVEPIDRLISNAGIVASPYSTTIDRIEAQFGTNHVGPFLFTNLIMPKILAAEKGARIVNISRFGRTFGVPDSMILISRYAPYANFRCNADCES